MKLDTSCAKGVHILLGNTKGEFNCSLVVDGQLIYSAPPNQGLASLSMDLAAIEIASLMDSLGLGTNRNIHNGLRFDEASQEKSLECDGLSGKLLIVFTEKLREKLPYVATATHRNIQSGHGHHSPQQLWDGIGNNAS